MLVLMLILLVVCVCVCVCPLLPVFLLLPFAYQKLNTSWRMISVLLLFSSIVVSIDRLSFIMINGHAVDRLIPCCPALLLIAI